jgi:hypothetical protein
MKLRLLADKIEGVDTDRGFIKEGTSSLLAVRGVVVYYCQPWALTYLSLPG